MLSALYGGMLSVTAHTASAVPVISLTPPVSVTPTPTAPGDLVERTAHNGYTVILSCLLRSAQHARELFFVDADKVKHFAPEAALSYIKINRGRLYRRLGDKFTGKPEEYKIFKKEYLFGFCPHIGAGYA